MKSAEPARVSRADAFLVSRDAEDRPVYGGTPADFAVVQAIQEMKARGLVIMVVPILSSTKFDANLVTTNAFGNRIWLHSDIKGCCRQQSAVNPVWWQRQARKWYQSRIPYHSPQLMRGIEGPISA